VTIEYALTRIEIVRSYFRSLTASPKFLTRILVYCVVLGLIPATFKAGFPRSLTSSDALLVVAWAAGAFAFFPLWLFARGKTSVRTLTTSPDGISTQIGSLKGQIPWNKIKLIADTGEHVLIVGRTGNAFFIPGRAFEGPDQKAGFLSQVDLWRNAAKG
jgi:hypothetical protein